MSVEPNSDIKISYIIPCHNSRQYIGKCLESFEKQTILPYEIIIIDDCSSDDTFAYLSLFKNNTKLNMVLYRNEINMGPSFSRKKGVELATGLFVAFSDSDDWLEFNANESLIKTIKENPSIDIILYDYYVVFSSGKRYPNNKTNQLVSCSKNELIARTNTSLWCCCVKKSLITEITFPNLKHEEDAIVLFQLIKKADSYKVLPNHFYNY